jgi:hypothetical protein
VLLRGMLSTPARWSGRRASHRYCGLSGRFPGCAKSLDRLHTADRRRFASKYAKLGVGSYLLRVGVANHGCVSLCSRRPVGDRLLVLSGSMSLGSHRLLFIPTIAPWVALLVCWLTFRIPSEPNCQPTTAGPRGSARFQPRSIRAPRLTGWPARRKVPLG